MEKNRIRTELLLVETADALVQPVHLSCSVDAEDTGEPQGECPEDLPLLPGLVVVVAISSHLFNLRAELLYSAVESGDQSSVGWSEGGWPQEEGAVVHEVRGVDLDGHVDDRVRSEENAQVRKNDVVFGGLGVRPLRVPPGEETEDERCGC